MPFTEFYCQTTGSNLNSGSTSNDNATFTYASGNWVQSTRVFTVASGNPSSDGVAVGDFASVYADGSTSTGFVGRVTARDATTITISGTFIGGSAPTDGTGNRTLKIGGAWKGPNTGGDNVPIGLVTANLINSSGDYTRVNFKNGVNYVIDTTTATQNAAGPIVFQGYATTVGDGGIATFTTGTSTVNALTVTGSACLYQDLEFTSTATTGTGTGVTNVAGGSGGSTFRRVCANGFRGNGWNLQVSAATTCEECEAYGNNTSNTAGGAGFGVSQGLFIRCIAHDNVGANTCGWRTLDQSGNTCILINCIADSNGSDGYRMPGRATAIIYMFGCDAYNNAGDGIDFGTAAASRSTFIIENCNLIKNGTGGTGYGINMSASTNTNGAMLINNAYGSGTQANASGTTNGVSQAAWVDVGSFSYPADVTPWVDPDNGNFTINLPNAENAGRGNFMQIQAGYSGTQGWPDIGAAQHRDATPPLVKFLRVI